MTRLTAADYQADADVRDNRRHGVFRRLVLLDPLSRPFLTRVGIDVDLFGIYLHSIDAPDPGLDMHDHPWAFATFILRGGYVEHAAQARNPRDSCVLWRTWRRWSVHRMRQTEVHRIVDVKPGTLTLVVRGRKTRRWGFCTPVGWVDHEAYDYAARRPVTEHRS